MLFLNDPIERRVSQTFIKVPVFMLCKKSGNFLSFLSMLISTFYKIKTIGPKSTFHFGSRDDRTEFRGRPFDTASYISYYY